MICDNFDRDASDADLAAMARAGSTAATAALFERHTGLLISIAARFARQFRTAALEDLKQAAAIGFLSAIRLHCETRGTFSSFAWLAMKHAVAAYLRSFLKTHLPALVTFTDAQDLDAWQPAREQSDAASIDLDKLLDCLDSGRRECVCRSFGIGHKPESLDAIAKDMGVSRETIRKRIRQSLRQLRKGASS